MYQKVIERVCTSIEVKFLVSFFPRLSYCVQIVRIKGRASLIKPWPRFSSMAMSTFMTTTPSSICSEVELILRACSINLKVMAM